jgi:tetratricopeptide (TPR) repeat protein
MEGARRIDEWSRIESRVPHLGMVPVLAPLGDRGDEGQLDLLPREWEVIALIDGVIDLRQIAHELGRSEFDVAKTVFGLESAGIVTLAPTGEAGADAAEVTEGGLGALISRVEASLEASDLEGAREAAELARTRYPQDAAVYVLAGRVSAAQHRIQEAEEEFRRALRLDPQLAAAHRLLGDSLARQGRLQEAVEWWSRWLTLGEEGEEAERHLKRVQEALQAAEALEHLLQEAHG